MEDYTANSRKSKEVKAPVEKKIDKVIVGEVVVKKKPFGTKVKDLMVEADFKSVGRYVLLGILIPAAKHMFVEAMGKGAEYVAYGESMRPRHQAMQGRSPIFTYQTPVQRQQYGSPLNRQAPPPELGPRRSSVNYGRQDIVLSSGEDADAVLEQMANLLEKYEVVSVGDMNELIGIPSTHVDQTWGWYSLGGARVRQVQNGYLIELPPAVHLN